MSVCVLLLYFLLKCYYKRDIQMSFLPEIFLPYQREQASGKEKMSYMEYIRVTKKNWIKNIFAMLLEQ